MRRHTWSASLIDREELAPTMLYGCRRASRTEAEANAAYPRMRPAATQFRLRRTAAVALFVLAAVIAILHVFEQAGEIDLLSPVLQELLLGYPAAAVLALLGWVLLIRE